MKEKITREEIIKKSKELIEKFETTDMTAEEVNNELIEFGKANIKAMKGEQEE
ncbi:hypothetical protein [Fusobacterium animalis]|uniref:hypothetical protein n=1 Tax=Fusobacterium animalis TaxID=76859 RepID=UPI00164F33EA|nr:hypothetical protein [Fusobacterium animalis]